MGSITEIQDDTGATIETYQYDSFGTPTIKDATAKTIPTSTISNPYMFTAREWDGETGLYFYRARYYDAKVGRFLSEDPILKLYQFYDEFYYFLDFNKAYPELLESYVYAESNPVNKKDSKGLRAQTPGCDWFPDFKCMKKCCDMHDRCYETFDCSWKSWGMMPDPTGCKPDRTKECQECNDDAVKCFFRSCILRKDFDENEFGPTIL